MRMCLFSENVKLFALYVKLSEMAMSTTDSSEEDGLSRSGRKRVSSGERSLSSRVNRLTSALQVGIQVNVIQVNRLTSALQVGIQVNNVITGEQTHFSMTGRNAVHCHYG